MRQAGYLAAAGIYALDNHVSRLKEDHARARELGKMISSLSWVESVMPVDTNIVIFSMKASVAPENVLQKLSAENIKALKFGPQEIRMVTHLDFDDTMLEKAVDVFKKLSF